MRKIHIALVLAAFALSTPQALAHVGHADETALTGAETGTGPLELTPESIANLDIKTVAATMQSLPDTLTVPATVSLIPEKQAQVTTRFDGQVRDVKVKLGQTVEKGQELLVVEPVPMASQIITLRAPIAGRITGQNVVLGQSVTFQTSLVEIADTREVFIRGSLYETPDIAKIKVGQKVKADIGVYHDRIFEGQIEKIDVGPAADSRVMHFYARFANADDALKPNLRGTLTVFLSDDAQTSIVVPASAVLQSNGVSFVFVRDGSHFERRDVQTGRSSGEETEILTGLFPDEQVVTQGNYQLQYLKAPATPHKEEH